MFADRKDAGFHLACKLFGCEILAKADSSRLLVLSIPRGGVVVGQVVARLLDCDHAIIAVKKIGFPGFEELAVGAIAEDSPITLDNALLTENDLTDADIEPQILQTKARIDQCIQLFRQGAPLELGGRVVILVDDGIATGETMKAAIDWIQSRHEICKLQALIVAVPLASQAMVKQLIGLVDAVVCVLTPKRLGAVGQFYHHFEQVSDEQVLDLLGIKQEAAAI